MVKSRDVAVESIDINKTEFSKTIKKRFFSQLNREGEQQQNEAPDAEQAKEFWSAIWSKEVNHNKDAKWLNDFKKNSIRKKDKKR